jgi:hypothetical protein
MSRYLSVAIPLILLWPVWSSWIFDSRAPSTTTATATVTATVTTTVLDTFILTSTILPTTTLTVTGHGERILRDERIMLKNKEFDKQLKRDREAAEAERTWEE